MNLPRPDQYGQAIHHKAPPLVTATYDNGHQSRQAVAFDDTLSFSFITQRYVDILEQSSPSPIEVMPVPPGISDKTRCPNGTFIAIERVLYATVELESSHFQFQAPRVCFVVYHDGLGIEDGIQMTLGHNWATKIAQAYA
ncbi:hypothetical protein F53441_4551 [Fusarium austroafricanum]|uniref:Uncharacterized protein n=1 Tax=Fusarium austroafricanum TaxID=2364996 RepID=A0A8H4P9A4_9HYPO|nr:hypothetical protein F53441_4551 [Fusarium austroafricanum]